MTSEVKSCAWRPSLFDLRGHRFSSDPATYSPLEGKRRLARERRKSTWMEHVMDTAQDIAERYVAVWNETDPERRRRQIAELWTPAGRHYVDQREVHGYDALEKRITVSHEKNVRDYGH